MQNLYAIFGKTLTYGLILAAVSVLLLLVGLWFIAWIPGAIAAAIIIYDMFNKFTK